MSVSSMSQRHGEGSGLSRTGSSHTGQGAFMHSADPSLSPHLIAPPPPFRDSMINHRTHNGRAHAPSRPWAAPSDLYNLMRIRHQVNNEWRSPSGAANSILLRVTFHPGPFTTLLLNMGFNPLKYQRWTNHINFDIASPGLRSHYAVSIEPHSPHLLCLVPLTDTSTQPPLQFFFLFSYNSCIPFYIALKYSPNDIWQQRKKQKKYIFFNYICIQEWLRLWKSSEEVQ